MRRALLPLLCAWFCSAITAQSLRVYSEFAQINEKGDVTAPARPREILSPAIVRNGFTSFQIVVQVPPGTPYSLYVGQNPEDAVRVTMYRESGEKLEPVELPVEGKSTQVFWMDVFTDRSAPVRRIKVEPQLNVNRDWIVYPMEARVMEAVVPEERAESGFCGPIPKSGNALAASRLRNARQDASLAVLLTKPELEKLKAQCRVADDPESYFKIRDYLFRMR